VKEAVAAVVELDVVTQFEPWRVPPAGQEKV
jgi:hypothetical protein